MNKNRLLGLILTFVCLSLPGHANNYRDIYFDCCPDEEIECHDDHGFMFGLELLFWNVCQSDLDYAIDDTEEPYLAGPGKIHFMDYDWTTGIRVYGGYQAGCMGWDGRFVYTYYDNKADGDSVATLENQKLSATLLNPGTPGIENGYECARAKNDLTYWVLDLQVGRSFCCLTNTLKIRPFAALRFLRLDQDIHARYENVLNPASIPKAVTSENYTRDQVFYRSEYRGVGLNLGMEFDHHICKNWGVYGICSGSIVTGDANTKYFQEDITKLADIDPFIDVLVDLKDEQCLNIPGCQIGGGVYWECCLNRCAYLILKCGYEYNGWWHTPQVRRFVDTEKGISNCSANGSIGLEGFTLRSDIYF